MNKYFLKTLLIMFAFSASNMALAQFSPGQATTPLPFFNNNKDGYAVLRDGTRVEGDISIGKRNVTIKGKDGTTYKVEDYSLAEYGLHMETPMNYSPVSAYQWKDKKIKKYLYAGSDEDFNTNVRTKPQRGFVELKSGEIIEGLAKFRGKIKIVGGFHSQNIFAMDEITMELDDGTETSYDWSELKGFGRVLPWNLSPVFYYKEVPDFGGVATKKIPGFLKLYDGTEYEGDLTLFKPFIQTGNSGGTTDMFDNAPTPTASFYKTATIITANGKEKIDIDLVYAYGSTEMTPNNLTNNGTRSYPVDQMNFYSGKIETNDGATKEGLVAYFPGPINYYGVYYAEGPDAPVEIFAFDDLKNIEQNINEIEEFVGFGNIDVVQKENANINGFIINNKGEKMEGTIVRNAETDWYCRTITFTNKDNLTTDFGADGKNIRYFETEVNGEIKSYIYHRGLFVVAEQVASEFPFTYFLNPFPQSKSFITKLALKAVQAGINQVTTDLEMGAEMLGNSMGWETVNTGTNDVVLDDYADIISYEDLPEGVAKAAFKDEIVVFHASTNEKMIIPKKSKLGGKTEMEVLLEGCKEYHELEDSKYKKFLRQYENTAVAVDFINECYK